ncbi:MAG: cytochrome b5-like heme/steroid binding domain-containing protein [Terracoccus sp.]
MAKESGEALADQVGLPADHAEWGDRLYAAAFVFAVVTVVWFAIELLGRRAHPADPVQAGEAGGGPDTRSRTANVATKVAGSGLARVAGAAVVVLSLVVLALTVVVGHSGATAVWGGKRLAPASASTTQGDAGGTAGSNTPRPANTSSSGRKQPQRTPASSSSSATRPPTSGPAAFSLADVSQHQSGSSCWAAVDGGVYDLTQWINDHPGGSDAILGMCGTDATAAFNDQHGGQGKPARELATFKIGVLR